MGILRKHVGDLEIQGNLVVRGTTVSPDSSKNKTEITATKENLDKVSGEVIDLTGDIAGAKIKNAIYIRSDTRPATPIIPSPPGWTHYIPEGIKPLWKCESTASLLEVEAQSIFATGDIYATNDRYVCPLWRTPVRMAEPSVVVPPGPPAIPGEVGDLKVVTSQVASERGVYIRDVSGWVKLTYLTSDQINRVWIDVCRATVAPADGGLPGGPYGVVADYLGSNVDVFSVLAAQSAFFNKLMTNDLKIGRCLRSGGFQADGSNPSGAPGAYIPADGSAILKNILLTGLGFSVDEKGVYTSKIKGAESASVTLEIPRKSAGITVIERIGINDYIASVYATTMGEGIGAIPSLVRLIGNIDASGTPLGIRVSASQYNWFTISYLSISLGG